MIGELAAEVEGDRRSHILDAAQRAFVKHGFQGASMQTIAAEARMSAGNFYRYFDSKEAIVFGLVTRDQETIARDFDSLSGARDTFAALAGLLRRHLVETPVERHRLIVEIWAEVGRNEQLSRHCSGIDRLVRMRLTTLVEEARRHGYAAAHIDPAFVVRVMATMVAGLFKRRATEATFDGHAELALALGVIRAAFDGVLQPYRHGESEPLS